jgi:hypothetical protein
MELTKECLEEITAAAREVEIGTLTITLQARPEDSQFFERNNADAKTARYRR